MSGKVMDDQCVGCNLCVNVCPIEHCITMTALDPGAMDARTGKQADAHYANWTTHSNYPMAKATIEPAE